MNASKHASKLRRTWRNLDRAFNAVYACGLNSHTPFNECFAMAPKAVQDAYLDARREHEEAKRAIVADGHAYEAAYGLLFWVRKNGRIGTVDYMGTR